jgi:hypothetical protein
MRIEDALQALKPKAEWVLRGDSYEDLEWLDKTQTKPTKAALEAKMAQELPEASLTEKLASVGLSVDDLKAALGL